MNTVNGIKKQLNNSILMATVVTAMMSLSGTVFAGVEASISILPHAQKQAEFLTKTQALIDDSLFKSRLVWAANRLESTNRIGEFAKSSYASNVDKTQWSTNRRQQHLYRYAYTEESNWQFLSVSLQQGDIALTVGNKYPKD